MAKAYYPKDGTWTQWSADMVGAFPYSVTTDNNLDNAQATGIHTVNAGSSTSGGGLILLRAIQ